MAGKEKHTHMPTHNKSGYEIRLEVLQMAMGLASERYHNELDQLRYTAERTKAQAFELPQDNRVAQALKLADELYGFVEAK